jgi:Spherulation-specific family 4
MCNSCYESYNDVGAVTAQSLVIDDTDGYVLSGAGISVGSEGITATNAGEDFGGDPAQLLLPVTLDGSQRWTIGGTHYGGLDLSGGLTGARSALTVDLADGGTSLEIDGGNTEIGDVAVHGNVGSGSLLDLEDGELNATDGSSLNIGADFSRPKPIWTPGTIAVMKKLLLMPAAAVVALVALATSSGATAPVAPRMLVPAYFDPPGRLWTTALSAPDRTILIVNPDNGPGTSIDPAYRRLIARARAAGHQLIGYVYTNSGARPVSIVERDIARWRSYYGVRDIFFDEVAESTPQLPYYRTVTAYARAHGSTITVLNPGTVPARGYFGLGAIVVTFEDTDAVYRHTYFPAWLRREPASEQANIVYAVPDAADAETALAAMRAHGVGVGYVTNAGGENPYAGLPPYYDSETLWLDR